jgi:tripartite ATP-independent transporter DctM subunit
MMEYIGIIMFGVALLALLFGFPVGFTFGGVAMMFACIAKLPDIQFMLQDGASFSEIIADVTSTFAFMPYRIQSIMENSVLMAVPLFIFMGVVLEKTRLAERLLESMGELFGRIRGGLAISTVLVGALLAASTGIVGASVVAMGLISLPVMLKHGYDKRLGCGTICASGTLGQIIPPSIVLIILGDVMGIPVGDLFRAAVAPGIVLVALYILYILYTSWRNPQTAPCLATETTDRRKLYFDAVLHILPPLALILIVLGSIFAGIATPTESSALGSVGALLLAFIYRHFSWKLVYEAALDSVRVTAMVFAILLGATAFSMAFSYTGGDILVEDALLGLPGNEIGFLALSMLMILLLGFFIDFVEISFIIVPILAPAADALGIAPLWFAILIAMNLQSSFLTPPFGFSLFYLKGVAPPGVTTTDIYRGVVPFILIQVTVLVSILIFPGLYGLA